MATTKMGQGYKIARDRGVGIVPGYRDSVNAAKEKKKAEEREAKRQAKEAEENAEAKRRGTRAFMNNRNLSERRKERAIAARDTGMYRKRKTG